MATFTIGGGNQGNISPLLTGKATPMSLPPGYLSSAQAQAAMMQKAISGVGADIGDAIVARAKEEERSEGLDVLISSLEERAKKSGEFPATQIKSPLASPPELPNPELEGDFSSLLVESDVDPRMRSDLVTPREDWGSVTTETQPGDALAGILGGDVAEKYRSGKMRSTEKEAVAKAMMQWEEHKHGEVVRELNQMKLDALRKAAKEDKAFTKASQAAHKDRMIPDEIVQETSETIIEPGVIDELFKQEFIKERTGEPYDPDSVLLREQLRSQEDFETRVPEGIKARTLEEQAARREDINLMWEWLGQPPLENYSPSVQAGVAKVYDELPEDMMAGAKRGSPGYKRAVKKRLADHVRESGETSSTPYTRTKEESEKWNLMRGRKPVPKSKEETAKEVELRKYEADYSLIPWGRRNTPTAKDFESKIRTLKREVAELKNIRETESIIRDKEGNPIVPQFRPPTGGLGTAFENILSEAVTPESISRMKPEDQALFTDMVEPLYTGGERVIGTEEVERVIPGREKSPPELRAEIQRSLMDSGQWTPDTSKKLDELIPEYTPGVLEQAKVKIGGVEMVVPGFMFDPVGKKYIEISTGKPIEFNEIQTKLASYRNLMKSAQRDVDEVLGEDNAYDPTSAVEYWQRVSPTYLASKKGLEYKDAAGRWIEARLRFATGAQAPATEYDKDWKNFFPVPGDSKRAVDRKKRARDEVYRTLSKILGAERTSYLDEGAPPAGGATGGTSGKFSFQGGELKLNK